MRWRRRAPLPDTKRSFGRRRAQRPFFSNVSVRTIHHGSGAWRSRAGVLLATQGHARGVYVPRVLPFDWGRRRAGGTARGWRAHAPLVAFRERPPRSTNPAPAWKAVHVRRADTSTARLRDISPQQAWAQAAPEQVLRARFLGSPKNLASLPGHPGTCQTRAREQPGRCTV